jgi:competence protein ComEA
MMRGKKHSGGLLAHRAFVPVVSCLSAAFVVAGLALAFTQFGFGANRSPVKSLSSQTGLGSGTTVTAYIVGAVLHPGVYTLRDGARISDLLHAGGGARLGADLVRVNLAALLFDGEEVYVPLIGEPYPDNVGAGVLVNINIASADTMHLQLGLSLTTAKKIVTYRQAHGSFTAVDQLLLVPLSRSIYDRIKNLVTV